MQMQIEELVRSLIKSWWENDPEVKITLKNHELRQIPAQKLFQILYTKLQNTIDKIPVLDNSLSRHEARLSALEGKRIFSTEEVKMLIRKETEPLLSEISQLRKEMDQIKIKSGIVQPQRLWESPMAPELNGQQSSGGFSSDPVIDEFNTWAKEPSAPLPSKFFYAEGDMKLRENCSIEEALPSSDATWIANRNGPVKYLFPNPNVIDQIGGKIDALYKITGNRRARGLNRARIIKACSIVEGSKGWVEYKGELTLL
jgi:hypothetical protein